MRTKREIASVILKLIVAVAAAVGVTLSASSNGFMGRGTVWLFFTIQSNVWMAVTCLIGLYFVLKHKTITRAMYLIKLVFTVSITLTGVVFCFVLAPTFVGNPWNLQNILTHVVVPVLSVVDFFVFDSSFAYQYKDSVWVVIPPIYYAIFAGIGYVCKWNFGGGVNYPYFFLNWGSPAGAFGFSDTLPFMGVMWWILAISIFLIIVGLVYVFLARVIRKALKK